MATLLAVDLGLRTGLAYYDETGSLWRYASTHFANREQLKRGVWRLVQEPATLDILVVEGDANLGEIWRKAGEKRGARFCAVRPEQWRERLLLSRAQRDGPSAKASAGALARAVIAWSGAKRPTSLRHDAAEAIAIGLYGVLEAGWLQALPRALWPPSG